MSIRLISQLWSKQVTGTTQQVLAVLCDFANDDGLCWPAQSLIAWKVGCTDRHVRRVIADLESDGVIVTVAQGGRGRHSTSHLRLMIDRLPDKPPYQSPSYPDNMSGLDDDLTRTFETPKPDIHDTYPDIAVSDKPSVEPSRTVNALSSSARRIFSNGPDDAERTAHRRADVFSAYADVFGIKECSAEWFRRWNRATADLLPDVLETLTPDRMRELSIYVKVSRADAGIRHTPDVALILEAESEFDRPRPTVRVEPTNVQFVKRTGGAARGGLTGDELMAWAEKKERGEL